MDRKVEFDGQFMVEEFISICGVLLFEEFMSFVVRGYGDASW